jgi:hypothetical protein
VHYENAALQVVHHFDSGALVTLACSNGGGSLPTSDTVAKYIKITAIQVNNLTNTGF